MQPRLLLAPAGHGKTEFIIRQIRDIKASEPFAPVTVIMPNAIQARGFRQRLSAAGGALGVDVLTFHSLYAELLIRAGKPIPLLLDPVRIRLLRFVVGDLCERSAMTHYAALRDKPGFISLLRDTIEELKRARITPDVFSSSAKELGARLEEIALVYSAYQNWLQTQNWADNEGRGWLAAIAIESNPNLGKDIRLLAVSGFDEFNPTQLAVLSLLANRAQETLITLTGDIQNPNRPAHHRFHRAQAAITSNLNLQLEAMVSSSTLEPSIANTEARLFESAKTSEVSETSEVYFLETQTRALEVRSALRWIKARVIRDRMKLSEVAILARDLEPYRAFLEEVASEFRIPLRITGGQPLIENPAVSALLKLLSLLVNNFPRRDLLDSWRTPYFDFSGHEIDAKSINTLDEISRTGRVSQGLAQWREAFAMWAKKQETKNEDGEALNISAQDTQLEGKFEAFISLLTPPANADIKEFIAFVELIIGDDPALVSNSSENNGLNIVACARENETTLERDVAALRAFKDVLRGLTLTEFVLKSESLSYEDFFRDLRGAVEAATYSFAPESGVMAASVLDARGLSFQAVALMGLSESEFPKQEREDILLRESDRAILRERGLPIETKLHGDEATLFYQAVTRARQKLLLTRPYLADDGQTWDESPFWAEIIRASRIKPKVKVRSDAGAVNPSDAASKIEWVESARVFEVQIKNGVDVLRARMNPKSQGIYEGELFDLSERFNATHGWSASRLESYGTCPFEFFIAYGLELEPRVEAEDGYDVRILGSMLHKILEDVYSGQELKDAAQKVFATAPEDYGFRPTALWTQQQAELTRTLEKTIEALNEKSQGFTPRTLEARFGMGQPSLVLKTEIGDIRLHGYIDRLDSAPDGSLRVIDYKSGGAAITAIHLKEGRRLQLPIYALAARDALGLGE
ncbi:MAG: PD-(D/E)XK nuclease family protein, partial [Anaerolineales bacterium]|nr:PD-(D/E)XK nuclease family protein [Anaerolineales bacterium]